MNKKVKRFAQESNLFNFKPKLRFFDSFLRSLLILTRSEVKRLAKMNTISNNALNYTMVAITLSMSVVSAFDLNKKL